MKTGNYRVRKGWFGKSILQAQYDSPSYSGGQVDSSVRYIYWDDIKFKHAPAELKARLTPSEELNQKIIFTTKDDKPIPKL